MWVASTGLEWLLVMRRFHVVHVLTAYCPVGGGGLWVSFYAKPFSQLFVCYRTQEVLLTDDLQDAVLVVEFWRCDLPFSGRKQSFWAASPWITDSEGIFNMVVAKYERFGLPLDCHKLVLTFFFAAKPQSIPKPLGNIWAILP